VLELLVEVFGELIFGLGWESVVSSFRRRSRADPVLARVGYVLIGGVLGALSAFVLPRRLARDPLLSVVGVLLNPLLFGLLSDYYGHLRRRKERMTTNLATFWGGALFAFSLGAARLAVIMLFY
jgi:hypothetical protein